MAMLIMPEEMGLSSLNRTTGSITPRIRQRAITNALDSRSAETSPQPLAINRIKTTGTIRNTREGAFVGSASITALPPPDWDRPITTYKTAEIPPTIKEYGSRVRTASCTVIP